MRKMRPFKKPTPEEVEVARGKRVPDVIGRRLHVLFCGINPGLYSGAVGHHFARPGNRFWKALHKSGFTPMLLEPWEERSLLRQGCGITNLVARATATAGEIDADELLEGRRRLTSKARRYEPRWVAILGISAYRTAFGRKEADTGRQPGNIANSGLWVLPNPSGLNAHYQLKDLARLFSKLREAAFKGNARKNR
jgi:TDG/mug DNA glycosylase family protein